MATQFNTVIIYSSADNIHRTDLRRHLQPLERQTSESQYVLSLWDAHEVPPGTSRDELLATKIAECQIIILLVSGHTFSDNFMKQLDYQLSEIRLKENKINFIPILVEYYSWKDEPILKGLQLLPIHQEKGVIPVTDTAWQGKEYVWTEVVQKIKGILISWTENTSKKPETPPDHLIAPKENSFDVQTTKKVPPPLKKFDIPMVKVEGGSFDMGGNRYEDEKPIHKVFLNDFFIGIHLVTQDLWVDIMGGFNPACFQYSQRAPIENISWEEVKVFLKKLNGLTGKQFRLPTESEWEYAARGGNTRKIKNYTFSGSNTIDHVGWYNQNSRNSTNVVGLMVPNALGLYDMCGNVCEWVEDNWQPSYKNAFNDGRPWISTFEKKRVIRGGSWANSSDCCRIAHRESILQHEKTSSIGFRLTL